MVSLAGGSRSGGPLWSLKVWRGAYDKKWSGEVWVGGGKMARPIGWVESFETEQVAKGHLETWLKTFFRIIGGDPPFELDAAGNRLPNPLGPIFAEGLSRPGEELYRWNVHHIGGSYTYVFLPKYPSFVEIANALGLDSRDVVSFHKFSSDDRRGVEFADKSYYELNRVW
jgi:hypothetical protein